MNYIRLAKTLLAGEAKRLSDGRVLNRKQLLVEAISCDPDSSDGYSTLAYCLSAGETVRLSDGRVMNTRQLFVEAIRCDRNLGIVYSKLGYVLSAHETVQLHDGRVMDKKRLFVEAIRCNPNDSDVYTDLCREMNASERVRLHDGRELNQKQLLVEALRCNPKNGDTYFDLAIELAAGETVRLHDGRVLGEKQLFVETLRCKPDYSLAYYNLGHVLAPGETVQLHDGRVLDKKQLLVEAIRCNPNDGNVYVDLYCEIHTGETVQLHSGRVLDKKQLCVEAIRCDCECADAYTNLGTELVAGETVRLHDGRELDKRQLFVEALRCDPDDSYACSNLGAELDAGETVRLHDGRVLDRKQLYVEANHCDPDNVYAYLYLGLALAAGETVRLHDGCALDKQQLFIHGIRVDSEDKCGYSLVALALTLAPNETVPLADGRTLDSRQLLQEAITSDLDTGEVRVFGTDHDAAIATLGEEQALAEAVQDNDIKAFAAVALRRRLQPGERLHLSDGSVIRRRAAQAVPGDGSSQPDEASSPTAAGAAAAAAAAAAAGPVAPLIPRTHFLYDNADDRKLGEGAHGMVFRGTWRGKPVALKVLHMRTATDKVQRGMEAEVAALSKLQHVNIAALYGAATVGAPFVLVAELMDTSLDRVLAAAEEELAWPARWRIAHGVAAGLAYLAEKGVVHGNLKSANVLLDDTRRVAKLSDLGRAQQRAVAAGGDKKAVSGNGWTIAWTAPELLAGPRAASALQAHASDVYAFGVVLWEMASRKLPFVDVASRRKVVQRIKTGQTLVFDKDAPKELVELAQSAWALDPAQRPRAAVMMVSIDSALKATEVAEAKKQVTALQEENKRLNAQLRQAPNEYFCPITREIMKDPVVASDGFSYERTAIAEWLSTGHMNSPMTNAGINNNIVPNVQLRKLIDDFRARSEGGK